MTEPTAVPPPSDRQHSPSEPTSELSMVVERLVRVEVEAQLAKEQVLLKESVGIAAKIIGAAAALFLAIFTIFGLTTWRDIKHETAQVVKQQAEELIQRADSETNVKDTLNDLLGRTIVSSYLAARGRQSSRDVTLPANDWDRLRSWIKKEDLPLQDFSDTLAVLNLQSDERKKTDANRVLAELLNPPEKSPYRWIAKQPEKTESILSNFKHKDLGSSAVELVASSALTDSVRGQAAAYVREVRFADGVERLLATYKSLPWGDAKRHSLVTCLALRPDQSEVVAEVRKLLGDEPRREKLEAIADMIASMPRSKSSAEATVDQDKFRALSRDLLLYATKNGLYFQFSYPDRFWLERMRISEERALFESQAPPPPRIELGISSKRSAVGAGTLTISEFRQLDEYWKLLAELANAGDIDRLRLVLPIEDFNSSFEPHTSSLELRVSAGAGAKVTVVEKGKARRVLDLKALKGANVAAPDQFGEREARIYWADETGQKVAAELVGLSGSNYAFSLERVWASK